MVEHAAFVHVRRLPSGLSEDCLWRLECDLRACLERAGVGELGGVEMTEADWIAFAYGPSADALVRVLHAALAAWNLPPGSYLAWRRGGLEAAEERHELRERSSQREEAGRGGSGGMRVLRPRDLLVALVQRSRSRTRGAPLERDQTSGR